LAAAPVIQRETIASFDEQKSPANQSWAPLKDPKKRSRPILQGLKEYTKTIPSQEGSVFSTNQKYYAKFHQRGTRYLPTRSSLPAKGESVPTWEKNVATPVYQHIANLLKGK